jgi:succinoglycan biosynthesis transport protein ExoP
LGREFFEKDFRLSAAHALMVLLNRWKFLAIAAAIAIVLALLYILIASPVYLSTAQVVLNIRAPETVGSMSVVDQLSPDYLLTQEDILKSTRVSQRVAEMTGISNSTELAQAWGWTPNAGSVPDYIAKQLQNGLSITASAVNSRVIGVGYSSSDPDFAAKIADAFATAYADITVDLQAEPARRTVESYTRQLDDLSNQLTAAQKKLGAKQKELGIISSTDQDADSVRLDALSSNLAAAQAQDAAVSARPRAGTLPDEMANPVIVGLQGDIAKLEGQRQQLASSAGPNNPDYKQIVSQIAELRQQLGRQQALIHQSVVASSRQTQSAVSNLKVSVDQQRQRVIQARANRSDVAVLEQDVNNLKSLYDQMAARRSQLQVLDNVGQTNVSILTHAVPSQFPVWPRKGLLLVLAAFGGLAIGGLIALALEFADRRLRRSEEFESWLGIPDLGAIQIGEPRRRRLPPRIAGLLTSERT